MAPSGPLPPHLAGHAHPGQPQHPQHPGTRGGHGEAAGHADHAGHSEHSAHGEHGHHDRHPRLKLLIAISIAVVSVVGGVVTWRAETAGTSAKEAERDGLAAVVRQEGLSATDASDGNGYRTLHDQIDQLIRDRDALKAAQSSAGNSTEEVSVLSAQVDADTQAIEALERVSPEDYADTNEPYHSSDGTFNLDQADSDLDAWEGLFSDINPDPYFTRADDLARHEEYLLLLGVGLVIALGLLTAAQLADSKTMILRWAIPGWVLLTIGALTLVLLEM